MNERTQGVQHPADSATGEGGDHAPRMRRRALFLTASAPFAGAARRRVTEEGVASRGVAFWRRGEACLEV